MPVLRDHPGRRGAVLAAVEVAGHRDAFDGRLDVGVVEDDHRCLAAQLEVGALDVCCGRGRHRDPGAGGAGDRHQLRDRVRDQRGAGVPVAADHVADARREELLHLLDHPAREAGRGVRRLEHDGVARRPAPGANFQTAIIIG